MGFFATEDLKRDLKQQNLKGWAPDLKSKHVVAIFAVVGVALAIIGIIILTASAEVVQFSARYDHLFPQGEPQVKPISILITKEMKPPIFFYYALTNFYQNHRRYVKSRSDGQLAGDLDASTSACEPLQYAPGTDKILYPCGLIASSFFNDTFSNPSYTTPDGVKKAILWTGKGIAWKTDREKKFKNVDTSTASFKKKFTRNNSGMILPMPENEDFIVWMRTAGLPNFKKLNKRILTGFNSPIPAGSTFRVLIKNRFPVESFKGTKSIMLSTTSWLGGKNRFLGGAYVAVGLMSILAAVFFSLKDCKQNKNGEAKATQR